MTPMKPPIRRERERKRILAVRFPEALIADLDQITAERKDGADRSAVMRELLVEAIEARKKKAR